MACEAVAYARAGLVGNPSDGYFGKTISFTFRNFAAKVSLYENPQVEIIPNLRDRSTYNSIQELADDVRVYGYYGGIRLMKATISRFARYCREHGIRLPEKNFSIRYRSNIPRHVGMAGSSALVTATLRCLMEYYEIAIPDEIQPNLILSVEADELGISAGLQDRVIQVYQQCVFMDFDRALMEGQGYGAYERLDPSMLPNLFIAYRTDLAEGSEVFHNAIRQRWLQREPEIVDAMKRFAGFAQEARDLWDGLTRQVSGLADQLTALLGSGLEREIAVQARERWERSFEGRMARLREERKQERAREGEREGPRPRTPGTRGWSR